MTLQLEYQKPSPLPTRRPIDIKQPSQLHPTSNKSTDNFLLKQQNNKAMPQSSKSTEKKAETEGTELKDFQKQKKLLEMESEYLNVTNGDGLMSYLNKDKNDEDVLEILSTYGLSIHRLELTEEFCNLIAKILSKLPNQMPMLSISCCTSIQTLLDRLKKSESLPQATKVCFAGSKLEEQTANCFVEFVTLFRAEVIVLRSVSASIDGLQALREEMESAKKEMGCFKGLEIYHNNGICKEGMDCIAGIVKDFSKTPLEIAMNYCNLTDEGLQDFQNSLGKISLGGINVCGNRKLTEKGFKIVGELVKNNKARSASLQDCGLDKDKIEAFCKACGNESSLLRIVSLNVANNPQLGPKGIKIIKSYVERFRVENLNVSWCGVEKFGFDFDFKLRSLDVSGNTKCEDITNVAKNVEKELYIRNCLRTKSQLSDLAKKLEGNEPKLEKLDLSDDGRRSDYTVTMFMLKTFTDRANSLRISSFALRDRCLSTR